MLVAAVWCKYRTPLHMQNISTIVPLCFARSGICSWICQHNLCMTDWMFHKCLRRLTNGDRWSWWLHVLPVIAKFYMFDHFFSVHHHLSFFAVSNVSQVGVQFFPKCCRIESIGLNCATSIAKTPCFSGEDRWYLWRGGRRLLSNIETFLDLPAKWM